MIFHANMHSKFELIYCVQYNQVWRTPCKESTDICYAAAVRSVAVVALYAGLRAGRPTDSMYTLTLPY